MVFTYEHKIVIKYLRLKYGHGAKKILDDHPEYDGIWTLGGIKDLLRRIDKTGDIERKEGSGRPRTVRTNENIEAVHEMVLSQEGEPGTHKTPAEIALELDISESSVRRIVDEDLDLRPLKKKNVQSLSEHDIERRFILSKKLLRMYTGKVLETAFFSDEKIFKVRQLYNVQNDRIYARKDQAKSEVDKERLLSERSGFPESIMVSLAISKCGKTPVIFVDPGAKVNAKYYCDVLLKKLIPKMDRLAGRKEYLFMQDGARSHTAKLSVSMLENQKHLKLLKPECWPANSPDLNPVDYSIWGMLQRNVYRGRKITDVETLKGAIVEEWAKIPQDVVNNCIDAFRKRLKLVVDNEGCHIEKY